MWGKGKRGTPGGSGAATLEKILATGGLPAVLAGAVTSLDRGGARLAYATLRGQIAGPAPSFFTKFLYFAGQAVPPGHGLRPLILDRVLSQRIRAVAARVGRDSGHDPDGTVAAWVWADGDWSPDPYEAYLSFMQVALALAEAAQAHRAGRAGHGQARPPSTAEGRIWQPAVRASPSAVRRDTRRPGEGPAVVGGPRTPALRRTVARPV
ncbi:hypothetical protein AB0L42_09410 [Streptomyces sp. NPDC052287]|uniref:8-oxoguanine DNA glycosylase OGG fold protein n=1 Tax=Streptomyces sp. NPDC052287 TaxID=3154950 RepID=UPI00343856BC